MHDDTTDDTTTDHDARCEDTTPPTDPKVFFVTAPIGEGNEAHRLARVGDWTFTVPGAEGTEPLIRDVDAAERLGFTRPRKVQELIERIWPENKRPQSRPTVGRQRTRHGGEREYTFNEYWLTEAELLKVCARSETPIAEAILDEMITVYIAVRRGLVPLGAPGLSAAEARVVARDAAAEVVAPLLARLALLTERIRAAESRQVPRADAALCGASEGERLRVAMRDVAHRRTAHLRPGMGVTGAAYAAQLSIWRTQWARAYAEVQRSVQSDARHGGYGKTWDLLPARELSAAWACILRLKTAAALAEEPSDDAPAPRLRLVVNNPSGTAKGTTKGGR